MNIPPVETTVGTRAFSMYCDALISDAVEMNNELRTENASLEAAFAMLNIVLIHSHGGVVTRLLRESFVEEEHGDIGDEGDETYMVYNMRSDDKNCIEFPWEHVKSLAFSVSGVHVPDTLFMGPNPEFTILQGEETIHATLYCSDDSVVVTGRIHSLSGSMDEVHHLIHTHQIIAHYRNLGMYEEDGNQPPLMALFGQHWAVLEGAIFTVDEIFIRKHFLQAAQCIEIEIEKAEPSNQVMELVRLAIANPAHEALRNMVKERHSLEGLNAGLRASRELFQNVNASYLGVEHDPTRLPLQTGRRQTAQWVVDVPASESSSIPLAEINQMQFHLASVPWTRVMSPMELQPQFTERMVLIVRYSDIITGIFMFDESLMELDLDSIDPNDLLRYAQSVLHGTRDNDYMGPQVFDSLTMRLVQVQFRLIAIQHVLDVIGADTAEEEMGEELER